MKCPHCNKRITRENTPDIEKGERNAESYGGQCFYFRCPHKKCKKIFSLCFTVEVKVGDPLKASSGMFLSFG